MPRDRSIKPTGAPAGEVAIRVRYCETDRMGYLHHSYYLQYLEEARTEILRARGIAYRDLEDAGVLLVITEARLRYRKPARYDDLLRVRVTITKVTFVRIVHCYEVMRGDEVLAEAETVLACVDREGRPQALPAALRG